MSRPLSPQSWQYRQLNSRAPNLSTLSDTLIELAEQGHPVVACTADLQYSNGLIGFALVMLCVRLAEVTSKNRTGNREQHPA